MYHIKKKILDMKEYEDDKKSIEKFLQQECERKIKAMNALEVGYVRFLMKKISEIIKKKKSEKVYFKANDKEIILPKAKKFEIDNNERRKPPRKKDLRIIDLDDDEG